MIIGLFPGLTSVGGVQLAGRQTAAALSAIAKAHGWQCIFLSLNDARGQHDGCVAGIPFRFIGFARRKPVFALKALKLARGRPKAIFAAHPNLAPIVSMMKAVSKDARTIIGAHGVEVWQPLPAIRRKMLRRADIVVAPSSDTVKRLVGVQGVSEGRMRRLPWPLDPEFAEFARCPDKLARPKEFPMGQVVLSVGRWAANERYKGADLLIQSVAELSRDFPELGLVLVGSGDDLPRLRELARSSGVEDQVHFFTEISRKELAGCYAGADIFALPSTGEGFGLVFLEAMAFGKAVIGANAGGIPDLVENGRDGFLIEPTKKGVSAALKRLLSDPQLKARLGVQGRRRVNSEFTFAVFQKRLSVVVDEIA
jgi:phosphatidyl-myo-inositol dimannoside synthase